MDQSTCATLLVTDADANGWDFELHNECGVAIEISLPHWDHTVEMVPDIHFSGHSSGFELGVHVASESENFDLRVGPGPAIEDPCPETGCNILATGPGWLWLLTLPCIRRGRGHQRTGTRPLGPTVSAAR